MMILLDPCWPDCSARYGYHAVKLSPGVVSAHAHLYAGAGEEQVEAVGEL